MRTKLSSNCGTKLNRGTIKGRLESCHRFELNRSQGSTPPTPSTGDFRLLEDSFIRLTESGDFRILE